MTLTSERLKRGDLLLKFFNFISKDIGLPLQVPGAGAGAGADAI